MKVLITGGSGCVGQHIIKHFQEHLDDIEEIRVLDLQTFEQKLEYECKFPVIYFTGSVTDKKLLQEATKGVQSVIHTAAYVDVKLFPDKKRLDLVNNKGTNLLLETCYENNVELFIYCSTVDVMQGFNDISNGKEEDTKPEKLLFGEYARTKQIAEKAVLQMNGRPLPNGCTMRTASLRPVVIYGDLDQHFVSQAIKSAEESNNIMVDFCGNGKCCVVYAGNVGWAFTCAHKAMMSDKSIGGEAFLVKDNTPYKSMIQFCKPYFDSFGITVYRSFFPYWVLYFIIWFIQIILRMLSPLKKVQFPITLATFIYTNLVVSFDGTKAQKMLKYKPLYDPDVSFKRSIDYYKSLDMLNKKDS